MDQYGRMADVRVFLRVRIHLTRPRHEFIPLWDERSVIQLEQMIETGDLSYGYVQLSATFFYLAVDTARPVFLVLYTLLFFFHVLRHMYTTGSASLSPLPLLSLLSNVIFFLFCHIRR